MKTMNVSTPNEYEKNGKTETFWCTIGTAFEGPKGITVKLNALPLNGTMFLSERLERETPEEQTTKSKSYRKN